MDESRAEELIRCRPELFDFEREGKLPLWAQDTISELRIMLLREIAENEMKGNTNDSGTV